MTNFSPREIVSELDRYIVGQNDAKRAVAIALRNRWRRQQLTGDLKEEVLPKNILMIGPTGVGKTEISRRLAKLAGAPFLKVEATKFTEVGYVGRDVESIIRDLVEVGIGLVKEVRAQRRARQGRKGSRGARARRARRSRRPRPPTRESFRKRLRGNELNDKEIEIQVAETQRPACRCSTSPACPAARWARSIWATCWARHSAAAPSPAALPSRTATTS